MRVGLVQDPGRRAWERAGADGLARDFDLTSVTTSGTGVQVCRYTRAR